MKSSGIHPGFLDQLQEICAINEVGFHFEEGGCWGMALALHERLTHQGFVPQIHVETHRFVHAFVAVGNWSADYRGVSAFVPSETMKLCSPLELLSLAISCHGCSEEAIRGDQSHATEMIVAAQERLEATRLAVIRRAARP